MKTIKEHSDQITRENKKRKGEVSKVYSKPSSTHLYWNNKHGFQKYVKAQASICLLLMADNLDFYVGKSAKMLDIPTGLAALTIFRNL